MDSAVLLVHGVRYHQSKTSVGVVAEGRSVNLAAGITHGLANSAMQSRDAGPAALCTPVWRFSTV